MAVQYTTTQLVAAIRRRGSIPTTQQLFSVNDFINLANDEMETLIVPEIMSVREEYFVGYEDVAVSTSNTPTEISIPADAVGQKLRDICWVDDNGHLTSIPRLEIEQASGTQYLDPMISQSYGFMIRANKIVLYPGNSGSGTIRIYYYKRPLQLTNTSNCGQVTAIDTNTNEVTLSFLPSDWTTNDTVNVVSQNQPFETKVSSVAITNTSFPTVTLASVDNIAVGDWIALEGFSPIPQIPVEAHKVLAQATVVKCMEAMGDREGMQAAEMNLKKVMEQMFKIISPRVDGAPKKVTNAGNGIFDWNMSRTGWRRW